MSRLPGCARRRVRATVVRGPLRSTRTYSPFLGIALSRLTDRRLAPERDAGRQDRDHYGYAIGSRELPPVPEGSQYERAQW